MSVRRNRGFTLIELMVASAIAAIICGAAAGLASAMARQVREVEEQGDIGTRAAIANSFITTAFDGIGYNWRVEEYNAGAIPSGAPGTAHCAAATGICTAGASPSQTIRPFEVCESSTGYAAAPALTATSTCTPPVAGRPDGIRAMVPRDDVSQAVRIVDRDQGPCGGTPCPVTNACDAANVPAPITFDVRGVHSEAWAVGDFVLVSAPDHATVGVLTAALPAQANSATTDNLSVNLDTGLGLPVDDGNCTDAVCPCDATASLVGARVTRVKRVVMRLNPVSAQLEWLERRNTGDSTTFVPILTDVDDLQIRMEVARAAGGSSTVCLVEGSAINGGLYTLTNVCGGGPLERDVPTPNATANRVVGLRFGILLRAGAQTTGFDRTWKGLFDTSSTDVRGPDQRMRRNMFIFAGTGNAASY